MRKAILSAVLLTLLFGGRTVADDWPQWRGPNRDGKSAETGLLKQWPEAGPTLVWSSTNCGIGYGAPSTADGRVYVMGNGENGKEWVTCLDEKTGKQLWACTTGRIHSTGGGYPGPRCTPTVADGRVYVAGLAGRVISCDAKTGQPFWKREMTKELGGKEPTWGYAESVLVDGGRVICTPGMEKTVVALDAKTGQEVWAAKAGDPASYSSLVKANYGETPQYVAFTLRGLVGIRAADGAILWRYDAPSNGQVNCATPLVVGSSVFAASSYGKGGGCALIQKDASGAFNAKQVYFTTKMQNLHGGYVFADGHLYGCCDPGVLVSLTYKTGVLARAAHTGRFSIAYADGMIYARNEDGRMDLYEASPTNLVRRSTFEQPNRTTAKAWAHPVIANGHLYLRDQYLLLCYDIRGEQTKPAPDEKPAAKPEAGPPAGETPAAEPAVEKPATKPAVDKPATKPEGEKPAAP